MIDFDDITAAAERIDQYVRHTPLMAATALAEPPTDAAMWLKLESLQPSGSFKVRGATNKLLATDREALRSAGVVTASGGNHALAVARQAQLFGARAMIYVSESATPAKIEKLKALGATVKVVGAVWDETQVSALAYARRTGAVYIHPFADPLVVAGQGTVALEMLADNPYLDTVLIAVGGGGLISGMSVALKALKPSVRIIGIEPVGAPTLYRSLEAGRVVRLDRVTTRVATMAAAETDPAVFELARRGIDEIVLVEDEEMLEAARWLWFELGLGVDLSGAAAVAALRTGKVRLGADRVVGVLICGAGPDGIVG
jgi:threonine dehydratase